MMKKKKKKKPTLAPSVLKKERHSVSGQPAEKEAHTPRSAHLCCRATSPRLRIWATSSWVGHSPAATQPKTPHSSPMPDSSSSISPPAVLREADAASRARPLEAVSACVPERAGTQRYRSTCCSGLRHRVAR